jgi:hypothetical protein
MVYRNICTYKSGCKTQATSRPVIVSVNISGGKLPKVPVGTVRGRRHYAFFCLLVKAMLWTVVNVEGWSEPRTRSCPESARRYHSSASSYFPFKRSPIPLEGIVVLSLAVEHRSHVVDGGQRVQGGPSPGPAPVRKALADTTRGHRRTSLVS